MKSYFVSFAYSDKINNLDYFDNEALEKIGIYHNINCSRVVARSSDDAIRKIIDIITNYYNSNGFYVIPDECGDYAVFDDFTAYNYACENCDVSKSIASFGFFKAEVII